MKRLNKILNKAPLMALLAGALAVGCGGGGGGTATATPAVSGVAATGAAIASGTVTLKCASGTTSAATTGADGSFTIDVGAVTLPCVGRVDYKNAAGVAQKLHTFISAVGTANITPITELLVANLTGGSAADAFDKFDAAKTKALTAAQIKAAATAVKNYLNTLGVATTNLPDDPVGTKFVAKAGAVAGDAFDKVLDDLQAKLALAGKTLATAVAELGAPAGGAGIGGTTLGTLTVSNASNAARNGAYSPVGAKFTSGANAGFNGQTADGKFEVEVVFDPANGAVKRAHVWFFDAGTPKFFGCDGGKAIACTGVGYEPLMKQILFNSTVQFSEVTPSLDGSAADALVGGGETLKVQGTLDVK